MSTASNWAKKVDDVLGQYGDPEVGHVEEDRLLWQFVRAVAQDRLVEPRKAARELLKLDKAPRQKWLA